MDHLPTFKLGIAEAAFPDLPDLRGAGVGASLVTVVVFRIGEADVARSLALFDRFGGEEGRTVLRTSLALRLRRGEGIAAALFRLVLVCV